MSHGSFWVTHCLLWSLDYMLAPLHWDDKVHTVQRQQIKLSTDVDWTVTVKSFLVQHVRSSSSSALSLRLAVPRAAGARRVSLSAAVAQEVVDKLLQADFIVMTLVHFFHKRTDFTGQGSLVHILALRLVVRLEYHLQLCSFQAPAVVLIYFLESSRQLSSHLILITSSHVE